MSEEEKVTNEKTLEQIGADIMQTQIRVSLDKRLAAYLVPETVMRELVEYVDGLCVFCHGVGYDTGFRDSLNAVVAACREKEAENAG